MNEEIKTRLNTIDYKLIDLDVKLNKILNLLEQDVQPNCKKMSSHIDFVDNVYENVVTKAAEKALPEKKNQGSNEPLFAKPKADELPEYTAVPEYTPAPLPDP